MQSNGQLDAMIDIETLGLHFGAVILSVGVVAFDPNGQGLPEPESRGTSEAFWALNVEGQLQMGFDMDWSTIRWWMDQDDEARAVLHASSTTNIVSLFGALKMWIDHNRVKHVWSHGAAFDIARIEYAAQVTKMGRVPMWGHREVRDTRTLFSLFEMPRAEEFVRDGEIAHHPVHDARRQARQVQWCMDHLITAK